MAENPLVTNIVMKFYEVQKYLTMSDHAYLSYVFMVSKKFIDSLRRRRKRGKCTKTACVHPFHCRRGL